MGDLFDGAYVAYVSDKYKIMGRTNYSQIGKKKFYDFEKAKTWAINYGKKHSDSGKFNVTIKQNYYHDVYDKDHKR